MQLRSRSEFRQGIEEMAYPCSMRSRTSSGKTQRLGVSQWIGTGITWRYISAPVWDLSWGSQWEYLNLVSSCGLSFLIAWLPQGSQTSCKVAEGCKCSCSVSKVKAVLIVWPIASTVTFVAFDWIQGSHEIPPNFKERGFRSYLSVEEVSKHL